MMTTHTLFIDAIVGAGFPSVDFAQRAVRAGLATYTGNQCNESWCWDRTKLGEATDDELQALYASIKEVQPCR